eukprot:TRINITY_DN20141_c0_g1_i1.p1 TRINITY_DN20141_c0_g1~~TRINITY_DN20141_c0_g1_i1.p1  ORF type:complete len:421 (+),score=77.04 TRINITY_DN20141_c0_g1_i1:69-1265(+)
MASPHKILFLLAVSNLFVGSATSTNPYETGVSVQSLVGDNQLHLIEWHEGAPILDLVFAALQKTLNNSIIFNRVDLGDTRSSGLVERLEDKLKISVVANSVALINGVGGRPPLANPIQGTIDGVLDFLKTAVPVGTRLIRSEADLKTFLGDTVPSHTRKHKGPHYKKLTHSLLFLSVPYNQNLKIQLNSLQNLFWDTLLLGIIDLPSLHATNSGGEWLRTIMEKYDVASDVKELPGGLRVGGKVEVISSEAAPYMVSKIGIVKGARKRGRVEVEFPPGEVDPTRSITKSYTVKRLKSLEKRSFPSAITLVTSPVSYITSLLPIAYTPLQRYLSSQGFTPSPSISAPPKKFKVTEVISFTPQSSGKGLYEDEGWDKEDDELMGVALTEKLSTEEVFEKM